MENVNLYNPDPITPVVKIKENISVLTGGKWQHYEVASITPMPRSSPLVVDLVSLSNATLMAASGTIAKQLITFLRINDKQLLHLRFEPIDDVEGVVWEQSDTGLFATPYVQARVTRYTAARDPNLATTTIFILGKDRDMNLEARNPMPVAIPQARFAFWGYKYTLTSWDDVITAAKREGLILPAAPKVSTYIPAEGRPA